MGWRVWGESLFTAYFSGSPAIYQPVKFSNDGIDFVLKVIKTWLIFYNNPVMTSAEMRIYSDNGGTVSVPGTPGKLIATSNSRTKASMITLSNGAREVWMDFTNPQALKYGDWYHFVVWLNGYTGDDLSQIAWMRGFPDPINTTNLNMTFEKLAVMPFQMAFIGADL